MHGSRREESLRARSGCALQRRAPTASVGRTRHRAAADVFSYPVRMPIRSTALERRVACTAAWSRLGFLVALHVEHVCERGEHRVGGRTRQTLPRTILGSGCSGSAIRFAAHLLPTGHLSQRRRRTARHDNWERDVQRPRGSMQHGGSARGRRCTAQSVGMSSGCSQAVSSPANEATWACRHTSSAV